MGIYTSPGTRYFVEPFFAASYLLLQPSAQAAWDAYDDKSHLWSRICIESPGPCCYLPSSASQQTCLVTSHVTAQIPLTEHPWSSQTSFNSVLSSRQLTKRDITWKAGLTLPSLTVNWIVSSGATLTAGAPLQHSGTGKRAFLPHPAPATYHTKRYHEKGNLNYCLFFKHQKYVQYKEYFYLCPKDYIHFKSIT